LHGNLQWAEVFAGYRSTVDSLGTAFWRELADAYPQAKVSLELRRVFSASHVQE